MLEYQILENKPMIEINGESGKDLLYKTIDINNNISGKFIEVNEYYIARPDLISLAMYSDDKYGDIICKVNGISNPFELNEGQILFIPSIDSITNITNHISDVTTKRIEISGKDNISNTNKIGAQKAKNERRSPNEQLIGDQNYIIDKSLGLVFY